jgi:hypothetical protein
VKMIGSRREGVEVPEHAEEAIWMAIGYINGETVRLHTGPVNFYAALDGARFQAMARSCETAVVGWSAEYPTP